MMTGKRKEDREMRTMTAMLIGVTMIGMTMATMLLDKGEHVKDDGDDANR